MRHWHKYVDSPLPPRYRFFFHADHADHADHAEPPPVAANLRQFTAGLGTVPDEVITFHALPPENR